MQMIYRSDAVYKAMELLSDVTAEVIQATNDYIKRNGNNDIAKEAVTRVNKLLVLSTQLDSVYGEIERLEREARKAYELCDAAINEVRELKDHIKALTNEPTL